MKYRVIESFTDLQDNGFAYNRGDEYPRNGVKPSEERVKELSTSANRRGVALIEEVRGAEEPKAAAPTDEAPAEPAEAVPVENEPRKRGRKRKNESETEE